MLRLKVISPEKVIFDGEVESLKVPGTQGSFEVLDNHAPIISSLQGGIITVKTADGVQEFTVRSGFIEVARNSVSICAEE